MRSKCLIRILINCLKLFFQKDFDHQTVAFCGFLHFILVNVQYVEDEYKKAILCIKCQ